MATKLQSYAASGTNYNTLTPEQAEFYQKVMLDRLQDKVSFMPYGKKANIPRHAGATTSWRRLEMPSVSTTAITEGVTPDGIDLTINKVSATVAQYGAWTKVTEFLDLAGLDPVITETSQMFGDHAALSMDIIVRNVLRAGTNVIYANNKTSRATLAAGDKISTADIQKIRATMVKNNVPPIKLPNGKQGYLAFTHPDVCTQLFNLLEWKDFNAYNGMDKFESGVVGQMYGIYFKECTTAPTFTDGGATANLAGFETIILGADAFGVPDIAGSSKPEILVYTDGSTENPMKLYSTIAWKSAFAAVILEQKRIIRYESLAA